MPGNAVRAKGDDHIGMKVTQDLGDLLRCRVPTDAGDGAVGAFQKHRWMDAESFACGFELSAAGVGEFVHPVAI